MRTLLSSSKIMNANRLAKKQALEKRPHELAVKEQYLHQWEANLTRKTAATISVDKDYAHNLGQMYMLTIRLWPQDFAYQAQKQSFSTFQSPHPYFQEIAREATVKIVTLLNQVISNKQELL